MQTTAKNVLGTALKPCCGQSRVGFYRDGFCHTGDSDKGRHVVCALVTDAFLQFSLAQGNDLITPRPEWDFAGLKAGDKWCLCASRWKEAHDAGVAPPVLLDACHEKATEIISLEVLQAYA
ncbi:DUF2237 family protein [Pseudomonas guineae]|uniref:DUF2237 family protein n=2 Tax=Pseudomonas guineae TaxID=425504 RepID=UPI003CFC625C